jgi:Flp pilus assembly protein TadG
MALPEFSYSEFVVMRTLKLIKQIRDYFRQNDGNVAIIFSLAIVPVLMVLNGMMTYESAVKTRASDQNALDSALLASIKQPTQAAALSTFNAFTAAEFKSGTSVTNVAYSTLTDGSVQMTASATGSVPSTFGGMLGFSSMTYHVNSTVVNPPLPSVATFTMVGAEGWWWKQITLWVHRPGATSDTLLATYTYQPTKLHSNGPWGGGGLGTLTASPTGTITLGSYDRLYMKMQVRHSPCPSGYDWPTSNADPVKCKSGGYTGIDATMRTDDPNTAYYLFVNNVELANGVVPPITSFLPCGQTVQQSWEDGGGFSVQDVFFNVTTACAPSTASMHISK